MRFLSIAVADDHPIFVEGLQAVLAEADDHLSCSVKAVVRTGDQLADTLQRVPVDLLLLDLNLPDTDSLKMLPALKKAFVSTRVLVMTLSDDPRLVKAAFKAGADGYMLKSSSKDELFHAIREVISGNTFLGRGVALVDYRMPGPGNGDATALLEQRFARKYGLTRREMEILQYIGQALNNKAIADKLFISDQTVSVHRKNIMRKLGVNNTANLIKIAFENNLV